MVSIALGFLGFACKRVSNSSSHLLSHTLSHTLSLLPLPLPLPLPYPLPLPFWLGSSSFAKVLSTTQTRKQILFLLELRLQLLPLQAKLALLT